MIAGSALTAAARLRRSISSFAATVDQCLPTPGGMAASGSNSRRAAWSQVARFPPPATRSGRKESIAAQPLGIASGALVIPGLAERGVRKG